MSKITKALDKARQEKEYQSNFLKPTSVNRKKPIRSFNEKRISGSSKLWLLVIGAVIVMIIIFNVKKGKDAVPLTEIFPDEEVYPIDVEYEFVDNEGKVKKIIETKPKEVTPPAPPKVEEAKAQVSKTTTATTKPNVKALNNADLKGVAFAIQVASFKDQSKAAVKLQEVLKKDYPAYIFSRDLGDKGLWYRVYVGKFDTRGEADNYLNKVKTDYPGSFVIVPK